LDKKFCNDHCRNNHNNRLHSDVVNFIRNVNNALRRNRRILEELMEGGDKPRTLSSRVLVEKGYNFDFFTTIYTTKENNRQYHYCYEYGYTMLEEEKCMVVRKLQYDFRSGTVNNKAGHPQR